MSTYVISDIHGQLPLFKNLLEKANFKYDYTDELYILGDLGDWGTNPIETMLFVKELCEKYTFVHCLMGNHDAMLVEAVKNRMNKYDIAYGMWGNNDGLRTFGEYKTLSKETQDSLYKFLANLPLEFRNVQAGGRLFHMAHAAPSIDNENSTKFNVLARKFWYRLELDEYPEGKESEYHMFIYGHTMTKHFIGRYNNIPNLVITDAKNMKMLIDCGGKAADSYEGYRLALVDLSGMKVMYSDECEWEPIWMPSEVRKLLNFPV